MRIDNLAEKILSFGQKINIITLRPYQLERALQFIKAIIHEDFSGTLSTLWARKSGKSDTLKVIISSLLAVIPELAKTNLSREFPRLRLYRNGLSVAFAGPKERQAKIPFVRLRRQAKQQIFRDALSSLDLKIETSNTNQFELSNGSVATAYSGSETASNEGPEAHCLEGSTEIMTKEGTLSISEVFTRVQQGKQIFILSLGKTGLEFRQCIAAIKKQKARSVRVDSSSGNSIESSYKHPIFTESGFTFAEKLRVGNNLCTPTNYKSFLGRRWEMLALQSQVAPVLCREKNNNTTFSGNTNSLKYLYQHHPNHETMEGGEKQFGGFPRQVFLKLKNLDLCYTFTTVKPSLLKFLSGLIHSGWQCGLWTMDAILEWLRFIQNALTIQNKNYFNNILLATGVSQLTFNHVKNEAKSFTFSLFQKSHFSNFQKSSMDTSFPNSTTKLENQIDVRYVEKNSLALGELGVRKNVEKFLRRKINVNCKKVYSTPWFKLAQYVKRNLQLLKIILQKPALLNVIDFRKIKLSRTGGLEQKSLLPQKVHITQIEHLNQEKEFFDLMVEENHNYFANGILVHNCLIIDEAQGLSPFSVYKILRPMVAAVDGLISETGTPGRKRCPFLTDIEYNLRNAPQFHQQVPYDQVTPYSRWYASHISKELDRLPGGENNPFFRMNYKLEWLIAEGHFVEETFLKLNTGKRGTAGGRLTAGVDWGKVDSSTTITILEDRGSRIGVADLLLIKGDWDDQFDSIIPFLKKYNWTKLYAEENGVGDPLVSRLYREFGRVRVVGKFMSAQYKDHIFTKLDTELKAKPDQRFEYFDDGSIESKAFSQQFLDAEQEIRGGLLSVHKSEDEGSADDFLISTALATDAMLSSSSSTTRGMQVTVSAKKRGLASSLSNF